MTYFVYKGDIHFNHTVDMVSTGGYFYTTRNATKGKYYFEFCRISGKNFHLVGFEIEGMYILAYGQGNTDDLTIYYDDLSLVEETQKFSNVGLTNYHSNDTVGVSFDTSTLTFSIYFCSQIKKYTIKSDRKDLKVRVVARESYKEGSKDRVKFNFGDSKFEYGVPPGYSPWNRTVKETYIYMITQITLHMYFLVFLLCS